MNVKVAVIGMGYWGKNLVRNFHKLGVLSAICDVDNQRQSQVNQDYPTIQFTHDLQSILNDKAINAVAIATPAGSHFALAKAALEAGKEVFVEKPLALTIKDVCNLAVGTFERPWDKNGWRGLGPQRGRGI